MKGYIFSVVIILIGCCVIGLTSAEEKKDEVKTTTTANVTVTTEPNHPNTTANCSGNATCSRIMPHGILDMVSKALMENKEMLQRTFYVLVGTTSLVVLYFVIKTARLRRRQSKSKKYGVISTRGQDNLEMIPLDQDEDDEDMTVFEVNGHPR